MGTLTGLRGARERHARLMLRAVVEHLEKTPTLKPVFHDVHRRDVGLICANQDAQDLVDVAEAATRRKPPVQDVKVAVEHALFIRRNGWTDYAAAARAAGPKGRAR